VSGEIAVLPIRPDGSLGPMSDSATGRGKLGPHKPEQDTPTFHHVQFDRRGRFVYIPSRGYDGVYVFTLDTSTGKLVANNPPAAGARSGAGPRHIGLHPTLPYAYVANELDSTVTTYRVDEQRGTMEPIQVLPSTPSSFTGNNTGSGIIVASSGRFVYSSNRGHDSIAIFSVDRSTGVLTSVGWASTRGKTPRFICFDPSERYLYALNQGSNTIAAFRVNQSTGALTPPSGFVAEVAAPTCVVFAALGATSSTR
jgi:6-phosphogluconolactonase (cycloisomerase 2 family)